MDNYGEGLLGRIAMLEDDLHAMTQARDDALRYCETIQADADKARMKTNYCTSCKGYADRIAALEVKNARLMLDKAIVEDLLEQQQGYALTYLNDCNELIAENERLRELLLQWDALIKHQYSGSREAMSDMQEAAFATVEALKAWREVTDQPQE